MKEIWKDIKGYEGYYQISNIGRVKSLSRKESRTEKIMKPWRTKKGYLRCILSKNSIQKKYLVHKIVAEHFVDNPMNNPQVNHINQIKHDNRYLNLEWVTAKENCNHGDRIIRQRKNMINNLSLSIPVGMLDDFGNIISKYPSMSEASRITGYSQGSISYWCNKHGDNKKWVKLKTE